MGWFHRHHKKKYDQYETCGTHTPTKSILRSSSRVNSLESKTFSSDNVTSMSLVNLRSSPPDVRRRFESTDRSSHLNGSDQSDSENDQHLNRGHRSVLFLDQVAAPDRYRTSRVIDFDSEQSNYSTFSHRSPPFSRTISPSSSSSLASYPANYEPSPLIRKKNFDDPGIELVSCSPLSCSSGNNQQQQQHQHHHHHNFKMHKFKPSIKRLSYLNAFSKKRKDFKRGNLTLILDQELDSICDNTRSNIHNHNINDHDSDDEEDDEADDDDDDCDNAERRESFKQFNEQNVYEELPRLDTLKLSSNNSYSNGVRDVLTTSNYNDDYFHKNIQQNKFNHTGNNVNDRKVTTVKIDRHRSDVQQSDFVYHPNNNPFKIHSKYTNDLKNNSISYHPTNAEHTPTGSTETLIDSTRKLTSTASINYLDEQNTNKLPSTGYVKTTVQCTNSYPNQIIDTNKTSWKTVSIDQSTKYNAQDMNINNSNNNINNSINNEYKVNPRNPRIIYISKSNPVSNENPTKLSTNQNKIVSASQFTHSSTVVDGGGYSPYGYESDQTNMNQFKHTNQTVRKTNIVTIEYENINNDNNNNNQSINKP